MVCWNVRLTLCRSSPLSSGVCAGDQCISSSQQPLWEHTTCTHTCTVNYRSRGPGGIRHTYKVHYCVLNWPIECFYVENVSNCKVSYACNILQKIFPTTSSKKKEKKRKNRSKDFLAASITLATRFLCHSRMISTQ